MNNTKFNRRNVSSSGSGVIGKAKSMRMNKNGLIKCDISGKYFKKSEVSAHHKNGKTHFPAEKNDINNITVVSEVYHRLYHQEKAYDKNTYVTIKGDKIKDTEADWNKFVADVKNGKKDKALKAMKAKIARKAKIIASAKNSDAEKEAILKDILKIPASLYSIAREIKLDGYYPDGRSKTFYDDNRHIQIETDDIRVVKNIRMGVPHNFVQIYRKSVKDYVIIFNAQ